MDTPISVRSASATLRRSARPTPRAAAVVAWLLAAIPLCGCTPFNEYVHNGFKVGPNYCKPPAPVAEHWIDADDERVRSSDEEPAFWWTTFKDPVLDQLICMTYHENLSLRAAGFRILEARAQLAIDTGELFPQTQQMTGSYTRNATSKETVNAQFTTKRFFSQWNYGFNLNWELDFWGKFRRAIESDQDNLDVSIENYDAALLTLLGDIATDYANMRTTQQRIIYAQNNVELQKETLAIVEARFKAGTTTELDVAQARSTLAQTEATIPGFEITLRQTTNAMCVLMGMPPEELAKLLGPGPIPSAAPEVAVGMPADLLRRRPDVRSAERQVAAQCALIGVAESQFYPAISINGSLGGSAEEFTHLFNSKAFTGSVGPSFQWSILNYGRIQNNVRLQNFKMQELIATYQSTVLNAAQDVENGLVQFLKGQEQTRFQNDSVVEADRAVKIALLQYKAGTIDFTRVTQVEQTLVLEQDLLAQAQGSIATGLVQVYRALGGGWQIRLSDCQVPPLGDVHTPLPEPVPSPAPAPPNGPPAPPKSDGTPKPNSDTKPAASHPHQTVELTALAKPGGN